MSLDPAASDKCPGWLFKFLSQVGDGKGGGLIQKGAPTVHLELTLKRYITAYG